MSEYSKGSFTTPAATNPEKQEISHHYSVVVYPKISKLPIQESGLVFDNFIFLIALLLYCIASSKTSFSKDIVCQFQILSKAVSNILPIKRWRYEPGLTTNRIALGSML